MNLLQHFRYEEQETVKAMMQFCERADSSYAPVLTPFLDPREQYILTVVVKQFAGLHVHTFGGDAQAERCRAIISPDYFVPEEEDFQLTLLEVNYPDKFVTLTHRNLLGSLMQTGIKREQLGDIRVGHHIQFVLTKHFESFMILELTRIKKAAVTLRAVPFSDFIEPVEAYTQLQTTVSSLRLDNVIQQLTKKSRAVAQKLIDGEHVKVNHTVITKTSFTVEEHDLLSIKGFGRAKVTHIGDRTKKDKIRLTIETLFN
ncbi:RNA-binding protein [Macrococcus equipercicus]|uniref:RNA-binding protein n=1 Tax=Macrococcus equipercicus TaxID=69967 RepID=A0ABQ6RBV4_9STAP|nr:RNA-binding protein [Macrococcus equipercicus]KAA1042717.1 RNA-binding protein [Macrococcus equipercicus]